ncbi:MAG: hypothetical protein J0G94_07300 [Sphingomonadales bacterium]|nr:hypothetical protein [Sphingomonadales bacterium]
MSRVVNLDAAPDAVTSFCDKLGIAISVIEPLLSGGTRAIFNNGADAERIRREMKGKLIASPTTRSPLYVSRSRPAR